MQVLPNALCVHLAVYVLQKKKKNPFLSIYRHSFYLMVLLPNKASVDQTQVMLRVILMK
jgi:hypothetical protein